MFGANGMVVRESTAAVDERLLGGTLDVQILLHFVTLLLHETKCEIKTRSAAIGVADMAAGPGRHTAFQNTVSYSFHRRLVEREDVAPHRCGFAYVRGGVAFEQEITDMREIVFSGLERPARACPQADSTEFAVDGVDLTRLASDIGSAALERGEHQACARQIETLYSQIALADFA